VLVMGAVPLLEGMPQKWHARACVAALLLVWVQPYAYATKKPFQVAYWKEIAQHIQHHWPKHSLIAINMAGYIPYLTPEYRYLDMLGLNDRHISRRPVIFEGGLFTTGHFKGDGKYILARKPDYIIFGGGLEEKYLSFYLSEKELMALAEFHKSYQRKKVYLSLKNMDIPENKQGFFFYQRRP
jgi:hypothetical protein